MPHIARNLLRARLGGWVVGLGAVLLLFSGEGQAAPVIAALYAANYTSHEDRRRQLVIFTSCLLMPAMDPGPSLRNSSGVAASPHIRSPPLAAAP
jgi:hypothetical protein